MFVLPEDLPLELTPFAFLVGKWEGTGVISYRPIRADGTPDLDVPPTEVEFRQRIEFAHDGTNTLTYIASAQLADGSDAPLPSEIGYWRIARKAEAADHGPGLTPGAGEPSIKTRDDLEKYRTKEGAFNISVSMLHPGGVAELYQGYIKGAQAHLASLRGVAFDGVKAYRHSTRMYGLVEGALLWAWDIALPGDELRSHASARLERAE